MEEVMLTAEVARFLGKSSETVRLYARQGKLPAVRTGGGMRLFKKVDVLQFAALLSRPPQPAGPSHDADE